MKNTPPLSACVPAFKSRFVLALLLLSTLNPQLSTLFAQGNLTPPGAPGPTFKTLSQIEPRTAITNTGAVTISTAGSYYLATNITVSSGNAITIVADNVTLDLNGFTISSTANPAAGTGIEVGGRRGITIFNGFVIGGVTNSGGVFSGSGFNDGIRSAFFTSVRDIRVAGITVRGCQGEGIFLNDSFERSTIVQSCLVETVGGTGIGATKVSDSIAANCGYEGITALMANHCRGTSIGSGRGVNASTADHCVGQGATGSGIEANIANDCQGFSTSGNGVSVSFANNCYGASSLNGKGVFAYYSAVNCNGSSPNGNGVEAAIVRGCYGDSFNAAGSGTGVSSSVAEGCHGNAAGSGTGVFATRTADSCYGSSSTGTGVSAGTANNCYGSSTNGYGINATSANNCHGQSINGNGLYALNAAQNCVGIGGGTGLGTERVANNCYGRSTSLGIGLTARIAIGCYGQGAGGYGISTYIANSCDGTGTPLGVAASFKYNMP